MAIRRSSHLRSAVRREASENASDLSDRTIGLLWLAGGVGVTVFTYLISAPGGVYVVAWGAILYGLIKVIASAGETEDDGMPFRDRVRLGQETTLRAMYFIAQAAGGANGARAAKIDEIVWRITDQEIPPERIAQIRTEALQGHTALFETLGTQRQLIPPAFLDIALRSAAQVALAEGELTSEAASQLRVLSDALGLPASALDATIADIRDPEFGHST